MNNGIQIRGREYKVYLRYQHYDAPARCKMLNIEYYNSYSGCHKCDIQGEWLGNRMCYPSVDAEPRILIQFFTTYLHKKMKNPSKLLEIPGIDLVKNVLLDSLHVVDLGVVEKLITQHLLPNLRPSDLKRFSDMQKNLYEYCPEEFQRRAKPLKYLSSYNGKDFCMIVLYTGPTILKSFLSSDSYNHFLSLHVALCILNDEMLIKNQAWLNYARTLLLNFVRDYAHIYGAKYISHKVHSLLHLVDDVETTGLTLVAFSSYVYESFIGYICKLV